ncbi:MULTISPECIES: hypothetical protein [unclassified Mesorhizobium]|uniref:hypothetical protein n=1 Tax=unclassified Mesorhizobium TaxID=325217 RepID=UPI000FD41835|nr:MULTISPECIES: hypothetical protein [unclassified Mesorhizobium]RUW47518.1 hypothetical protein EOA36_22865 [Mesorhizobium sp. M8A.F.Ca.ET.021.01.1.1]TGQ61936.1 hypothetical protein EN855_033390 [Mesorhizobium sp. M1C.F.Ca.ET.212.01.1.1]
MLVTEPYELLKGDIFRHVSPSGGGYGDPLDRSLDDIRYDLLEGYSMRAHLEAKYGVIFTDGEVDAAKTSAARARLRSERAIAQAKSTQGVSARGAAPRRSARNTGRRAHPPT